MKILVLFADAVKEHYLEFNFYKGIDLIMACLRHTNLFMQDCRPWDLKGPLHQAQLETVLHVVMETLRVCGILLLPVIPILSNQLLDRLSVQSTDRTWQDLKPFANHVGSGINPLEGKPLGASCGVLFKKLELDIDD